MSVLTLKENEKIPIGNESIMVVEIHGKQIRLEIETPEGGGGAEVS
ncbi:MAG: carbon storage regulator [Desulfobaccales bacterium]